MALDAIKANIGLSRNGCTPASLQARVLGQIVRRCVKLCGFSAPVVRNETACKDRIINKQASIRARWAQELVKTHILNEMDDVVLQCEGGDWTWLMPVPFIGGDNGHLLLRQPPRLLDMESRASTADQSLQICIIGAGVSGLYLGMLLDSLRLPHLSYDILESSDRTGGRIYTHRFGPGEAEYYDVGAMRFPKIPPLKRAFDLFERCDVELAPYDYKGQKCPKLFNGVALLPGEQAGSNKDPFHLSMFNGGVVPDRTVAEGPDKILERAFAPFITKLADNFQEGFVELMRYDHMTTRDYLREKIGLDFYSIWYMETVSSASGLYNQSLTEAILDTMDFEYPVEPGQDVEWYRVAGGSSRLVEQMETRLSSKPTLGARVVSIAYNPDNERPMSVQVEGEARSRQYSAVFNTTSLPCLRRMALEPGILSPGQRAAVQAVHYDASTKVAIKFKTAWWTRYCDIRGGQAVTDLPIRVCVYPSLDEGAEQECAVLLCSYTWGQDAQQMASLINRGSAGAPSTEIEQLLRHNLALLHQNYVDPSTGSPYGYARMLGTIQEEYDGYHAYDWYADPSTSGAFAYFGPGQFSNFYPELVKPAAGGHLYLVGEACSAHHGWVSGSLDSAYRALLQYLYKLIAEGRVAPGVLHELNETWGPLDEVPEEVLEWQVFLARLRGSRFDPVHRHE